MYHSRRKAKKTLQSGQTLPLIAVMIFVLLLMVGLAVDMGYAMVTQAALSKACDAAVLAGIRNYPLGETEATTIAKSAFTANYNQPPRSATPTLTLTWGVASNGGPQLTASATVAINTFFIKILPQWQHMTVASNAQTQRAIVDMALSLDRSGSMNLNGGAAALPPAVETFISFFDNTLDSVSESSFSTNSTEDVPLGHNFSTPITNSVKGMQFVGGTWSYGSLLHGQADLNGVVIPPGANTVKVLVFFTDGRANMAEDILPCPNNTIYLYGGCSPYERVNGCTDIGFWADPTFVPPATLPWYGPPSGGTGQGCGGGTASPNTIMYPNGCGCSATGFVSQQTGKLTTFTQNNIVNESEYRSEVIALALQNTGTYIYTIGMETPGENFVNQPFLQQLANDPASPTFNPNLPIGAFVDAPSSADLNSAFQTIAQKILYRLTQ